MHRETATAHNAEASLAASREPYELSADEMVGIANVTHDFTAHRVDTKRSEGKEVDKPRARAALDGVRVVVVEDEADARELIQLVLERSGAEVRAAASAAEGLEAVEAFSPHVIVSDIGMPHEDGYSFMRRVRGLPEELGGAVAAVALTAYTRDEDRLHALKAGYNRHLAKPAHPDALISTIRELVEGNPQDPSGVSLPSDAL